MSISTRAEKLGAVLRVFHLYGGLVAISVGAGMIFFPAGIIAAGVLLVGLELLDRKT